MRIRIVTEGASAATGNAPSVTSLLATRHLPRFTGEEKAVTCPSRPPPTARPRLETLMASLLWRLAVSRTGLRPATPRRLLRSRP